VGGLASQKIAEAGVWDAVAVIATFSPEMRKMANNESTEADSSGASGCPCGGKLKWLTGDVTLMDLPGQDWDGTTQWSRFECEKCGKRFDERAW
jgi:hypothetical protein